MSHPITQGRRIRTVNGVGYNLTWLGEREGRLCRLIFDLHSFDLRTLKDIEQLIPLRKIHVACDISGREALEKIIRIICDEYPQYIDLICPERRSACVTE